MTLPSTVTVALAAVFGWIGGEASSALRAWVGGRLQSYEQDRRAHRDELIEKVLRPLREGIEKHFKPLVTLQQPLLSIEHAATEFDFNARVTEEPTKYGPHLVARFPSSYVFGQIESALLHDARTNHFPKPFSAVDSFISDWMSYAADCHAWAARLARRILEDSGLPAFPSIEPTGAYVMHHRLAVFLYLRLFRFPAGTVEKDQQDGARCFLRGGSYTLASGTVEQIDALIATLDTLQESESEPALQLRDRANAMHSRYQQFEEELGYAIADRRLHGRCGFVPLWVL